MQKYTDGIKVYVMSPEISEQVQEHAFKLEVGFKWLLETKSPIVDSKKPFLFFDLEGKRSTRSIMHAGIKDFKYFKDHEYTELTAEEFLKLTPEDLKDAPGECREFDLEPFDKVLVREGENNTWVGGLFSFKRPSRAFPFHCNLSYWSYIIKYTPELKRFIGTTDNIPGAWGPDSDLTEKKLRWGGITIQLNPSTEWLKENLKVGDEVILKSIKEWNEEHNTNFTLIDAPYMNGEKHKVIEVAIRNKAFRIPLYSHLQLSAIKEVNQRIEQPTITNPSIEWLKENLKLGDKVSLYTMEEYFNTYGNGDNGSHCYPTAGKYRINYITHSPHLSFRIEGFNMFLKAEIIKEVYQTLKD